MKTDWESGGIAPRIFNLGIRRRGTSRLCCFVLGERPRHALKRRLHGPHSLSGPGGEGKIPSLTLPVIEPRSSSP